MGDFVAAAAAGAAALLCCCPAADVRVCACVVWWMDGEGGFVGKYNAFLLNVIRNIIIVLITNDCLAGKRRMNATTRMM